MKLPTTFDDTVEFLKEYGALEEGHFQLASGRHSGHYVMKGKLVQYPRLISEMLQAKEEAFAALGPIDLVLSPAIGGIPVGQQVAEKLNCRHIYSERDNENNMILKRGFEIKKGERVLMVEDVITTGGTLGEIEHFAQDQGGEVAGVFVLVNRSGKENWESYPILSCLEVVFPTYDPSELPSELEAIEVHRPGTKKVI